MRGILGFIKRNVLLFFKDCFQGLAEYSILSADIHYCACTVFIIPERHLC